MVNQDKQYTVENLTQKINSTKALYLTDYRGLGVNQMVELRRAVKNAGGELQVIKNRLLMLALKGSTNYHEIEIELTGPTAALWAIEDEISPLKAFVQYAKTSGIPQLKVGFLDQKMLSNTEVEHLSQVPGINELKNTLVSILAGPLYGLVRSLNWNQTRLVYALKSISDSKKE